MSICSSSSCRREATGQWKTCGLCRERARKSKMLKRRERPDLCAVCLVRPKRHGLSNCQKCYENLHNWLPTYLAERRAKQACPRCGKKGVLKPGKQVCDLCRPKARMEAYHTRLAAGRCGHCGHEKTTSGSYCEPCLEKARRYQKARRQKVGT